MRRMAVLDRTRLRSNIVAPGIESRPRRSELRRVRTLTPEPHSQSSSSDDTNKSISNWGLNPGPPVKQANTLLLSHTVVDQNNEFEPGSRDQSSGSLPLSRGHRLPIGTTLLKGH